MAAMRSKKVWQGGVAPGQVRQVLHRLAARGWFAASLATLGMVAATSLALATLSDYRTTLEEGWQRAESTALLLARDGEHTLRVGELTADRVAEQILRDGPDRFRSTHWLYLADLAARSPEIGSIQVIGPDGRLVAGSRGPNPPGLDLSLRDPVGAMLAGGADRLGDMAFCPVNQVWSYSHNRAVRQDGRLVAIVQASMHATSFRALAERLNLGPGAMLALARPDGAALMRWPLSADGTEPPPLPPGRAPRQEVTDAHGRALLLAWRESPGSRVMAAAGLSRQHVLAPFRGRLLRNGALAGAAALLAAVFLLGALRAARREVEAHKALEAHGAALTRSLEERDGLVASLAEGEARLRLAQQAGGIGLWDWDVRGDRLTLLGEVFRAWGRRHRGPRPSADAVLRAIHPEDRDRVSNALVAALRGEAPLEVEFRIHRPGACRRGAGDATRWIAARAEVLRGQAGAPRRMIGIAMDVTARRRAADALAEANATLEYRVADRTRALAEANARLRDGEARFRGIFNATFQMIVLLSPEGIVLEANDAALGGAYGAPLEVGRPLWAGPWPADAAEAAADAVARASTGEFVRQELGLQRADGRPTTVDFSVKPVLDEAGEVVLLVAEARDISELKLAQAQLLQAQKLETLGHLTGGVAHDFNNLLMAVLGNLRIALKRLPDGIDPRIAHHIEGAVQGAERGATLTARLLAFARRQDLRPRSVNVTALLDGMANLLERSCGPLVELRVEAAPALPPALVDPHQLELALLNLAVNARDAMPQGGSLLVSAAEAGPCEGLRPGRYLRISVADSGHGMDMATLARAVEPFFSTKGPGRGTGLGLSMVHGLAAQSGGTLVLDSSPGQGTVASIWLPVGAPVEAPQAESRTPDIALPSPGGLVLVVDDQALILESTAALVADLGYQVVTATSGEAAVELLRAQPGITALLTDYAMPGMTGAVLIARAREIRPGLPVVLATGYAASPSEEAPAGLPEDVPRLSKPYGQPELAAVLAEAITAARTVSV